MFVLYGVGLGPGSMKLMTLKAIEVIKTVDEVIVPGKKAYEIVKEIREPRLVEFPMGRSYDVARNLASELAVREDDVAFCCLGDPVLYSTFHHLVEELLRLRPDYEVEIVPGVSSISAALALSRTFVSGSMIVTTQNFDEINVAVVLKAKNPVQLESRLRRLGFENFVLLENMFMDGERIYTTMPGKSSYFSVLVARR